MNNILFICALPEEKAALTETLSSLLRRHLISAPLQLHLEQYRQQQLNIYVCESGMGNVNAGVKLALILANVEIQQIVLIGVGGALTPALEIGEMVLSDAVIQHDYYSSLIQGDYLMQPGDLILEPGQALQYDPIMRSAVSQLDISELVHPKVKVNYGLIASGCEFVATAKRKAHIHQQCQNALLVDMEACAIAQVANAHCVPFFIAKTVSDKLHSDGSISSDFSSFLSNASRNAAIIAGLIIDKACVRAR
ncbi:MAG: hypothetical protein OFPI_23880 [Osedax symbiont Rs2]|nr:MAG: hypothetical protein OFPI_23880 [Osedax symbiont Rs2]